MGRAQVKFRATHGRGRGRGAGASRGRGGARSSGSGGRSLGSNAFRYEEREGKGEEEDEEEEVTTSGRRQFFADEKRYRPARGATAGTYFQSKTVRQWEADAAEDDVSFGVLDFNWLAEQLARVPPAIRYRMDPKDCVGFSFHPADEDAPRDAASDSPRSEDKGVAGDAPVPSVSAPPAALPSAADEEALDSLLELSAAAATAPGGRVGGVGAGCSAVAAAPPATASQAQMEDWLDDVLDM